jgi:O-antigen/teichoic acid export membrane protein
MEKNNAARSGIWVLADNVSGALLAVIFLIVTAHFLSPFELGVGVMAVSIFQLLTPLVDSLFHDAVVQRADLDRRHLASAHLAATTVSAAIGLFLLVLAPRIAGLIGQPRLGPALPWIGLAIFFTGVSSVPAAYARRQLRFKLLAIRTLTGRSIATVIGIVIAVMGGGMWALVTQTVITAIAGTILIFSATAIPLRGNFSFAHLRQLFHFAAASAGAQFLLYAAGRILVLIIGTVLGPARAAVWSVGFRLVEPLQWLMATTVGHLSLPLFALKQGDRPALAKAFLVGTHYSTMLVAPVLIGIILCAPQIVTVFLGAKWLAAVPIVYIASAVTLVTLIRQLAEIVMTSLGKPGSNFWVQLQAAMLSLGGAALGSFISLYAMALGWSLRVIPFLFMYGIYLKREVNLPLWRQVQPALRPLVACAGMSAAIIVLQKSMGPGIPPALLLALCAVSGIAVYLACLVLLDGDARAAITEFAGPLGRRRLFRKSAGGSSGLPDK